MPDERQWDAIATITVDGKTAGPYILGKSERITIGRSDRAGLRSPSPRIEVPRELARLRCTQKGWMLENEGGTVGSEPKAVRIIGPDIQSLDGAVFGPHAFVLLSRGTWTLKWDVGVVMRITLEPADEGIETVGDAVDEPRRPGGMATILAEPVKLSDLQHRNMTALFAYLIRGEPEPKDPYAEAARLLEADPGARERTRNLIRSQHRKIAQRISRTRPAGDQISSLEELGHHLVDVTGTLDLNDLED